MASDYRRECVCAKIVCCTLYELRCCVLLNMISTWFIRKDDGQFFILRSMKITIILKQLKYISFRIIIFRITSIHFRVQYYTPLYSSIHIFFSLHLILIAACIFH